MSDAQQSGPERRASRPLPAWGHATGALAMGRPVTPAVRSASLDRLLIKECGARYCWAYDERRADLLEACFSADAVWEGTVGDEHRVGPFNGREEICGWLTRFWPHQHRQPRHILLDTIVDEQTARVATALSYLLLITAQHGEVSISTTGFYRLSLRREDGEGWRIAHLFAGFDAPFWPGKLEQLSARGRVRHGLSG